MGLLAKRVRFQAPAAAGSQAVTGVGFIPKAILFFADHQVVAPAVGNTGARSIMGCCTAPTERWSTTDDANTGLSGSAAGRHEQHAIAVINTATAALDYFAELASFDADGFTLTWTNTPNQIYIEALCLGGDIDAEAGTIVASTGTTEQTKAGLGFQPDALILASRGDTSALGNSGTDWKFSMGVAARDDLSQGAVATFDDSSTSPRNPHSYNNAAHALGSIEAGSLNWTFTVNSFNSDGWKWQHDVAGAADRYLYLAIKGTDPAAPLVAHVESHTQPGSTGAQVKSGLGFDPKALLGFSIQEATADNESTAPQRDMALVRGCCGSDASEASLWAHSEDTGTGTADSDQYHDTTFLSFRDNARTALAVANVTSLDTDGYTLDWTTADASGRKFFVLALGDGPAATSRTKVKAGGSFSAGKPVKVKSGGTFTEKPHKVKVGGSFV